MNNASINNNHGIINVIVSIRSHWCLIILVLNALLHPVHPWPTQILFLVVTKQKKYPTCLLLPEFSMSIFFILLHPIGLNSALTNFSGTSNYFLKSNNINGWLVDIDVLLLWLSIPCFLISCFWIQMDPSLICLALLRSLFFVTDEKLLFVIFWRWCSFFLHRWLFVL